MITKRMWINQAGLDGGLAPSLRTRHAGLHLAVHRDHRAVAG